MNPTITNTTPVIEKIIKKVYSKWKTAWAYRTKHVHEIREQHDRDFEIQRNDKKLKEIYENQQDIHAEDRIFLEDSLEEHNKRTGSHISTWLAIHYNEIKHRKMPRDITKTNLKDDQNKDKEDPDVNLGRVRGS